MTTQFTTDPGRSLEPTPTPGDRPDPLLFHHSHEPRGDVCEWITLSRIRDRHIVVLSGKLYDHGILLGAHLAGTVRRLIAEERVRPVQEGGHVRLVLTPRGEYRLAAMERITMRRLRLARHG